MTDTLPDVPALLALPALTDRVAYTLFDGRVYVYDATATGVATDEFYAFPTPRIVGGTVITAPAGGVLRLVHDAGVLRPEWYGEPADFADDVRTHRVLVHVLDVLAGRTLRLLARPYDIAAGLSYDGTGAIEGEGTNLNDQTRLRLTQPADYVLRMRGQGNRLCNLTVDANRLAGYAIQEAGTAYAERRGVKVTGATRDGVRLLRSRLGPNIPPPPPTVPPTPDPDATNNDGQQWERCAFWFNGTAVISADVTGIVPVPTFERTLGSVGTPQRLYTGGTASAAASEEYVSGTDTIWTDLDIQPGDVIWIQGEEGPDTDFVGEVSGVESDILIRLRGGRVPLEKAVDRPFAILKGCGWRDERHNDNNICQLNWPFARGNAHAGILVDGLYGHALINGQYDENGCFGVQVGSWFEIGQEGNPVKSFEMLKPYFENNGYYAAALLYVSGFTITSPLWDWSTEPPYLVSDGLRCVGVILGDFQPPKSGRSLTVLGIQAP